MFISLRVYTLKQNVEIIFNPKPKNQNPKSKKLIHFAKSKYKNQPNDNSSLKNYNSVVSFFAVLTFVRYLNHQSETIKTIKK